MSHSLMSFFANTLHGFLSEIIRKILQKLVETFLQLFKNKNITFSDHILLKQDKHYVKSVRIRSYSGPYFPAFRLNTKRYEISVQMR